MKRMFGDAFDVDVLKFDKSFKERQRLIRTASIVILIVAVVLIIAVAYVARHFLLKWW